MMTENFLIPNFKIITLQTNDILSQLAENIDNITDKESANKLLQLVESVSNNLVKLKFIANAIKEAFNITSLADKNYKIGKYFSSDNKEFLITKDGIFNIKYDPNNPIEFILETSNKKEKEHIKEYLAQYFSDLILVIYHRKKRFIFPASIINCIIPKEEIELLDLKVKSILESKISLEAFVHRYRLPSSLKDKVRLVMKYQLCKGFYPTYIDLNEIKELDLDYFKAYLENYMTKEELTEYLEQNISNYDSVFTDRLITTGMIHSVGHVSKKANNQSYKIIFFDRKTIDLPRIQEWIMKKEQQKFKKLSLVCKEEKEKIDNLAKYYKQVHPFLETAFYLYYLNRYAKIEPYKQWQHILYYLKHKALFKAYLLYPELFRMHIASKYSVKNNIVISNENFLQLIEFLNSLPDNEEIDDFSLQDQNIHSMLESINELTNAKKFNIYRYLIECEINHPSASYSFHLILHEFLVSYRNYLSNDKDIQSASVLADWIKKEISSLFKQNLEFDEFNPVPMKLVIEKVKAFIEG